MKSINVWDRILEYDTETGDTSAIFGLDKHDLKELQKLSNNRPEPKEKAFKYTIPKLGEKLPNNIRFWGHKKIDKKHNITFLFICPECGELFRTGLASIMTGARKKCKCTCKG